MKSFANCPNSQYAIIRASSAHDSPELLVLAYADEKSLRSLIAEPSILALGFPSRSAADAAGSFLQTAGKPASILHFARIGDIFWQPLKKVGIDSP
jgi:hypothetical protein